MVPYSAEKDLTHLCSCRCYFKNCTFPAKWYVMKLVFRLMLFVLLPVSVHTGCEKISTTGNELLIRINVTLVNSFGIDFNSSTGELVYKDLNKIKSLTGSSVSILATGTGISVNIIHTPFGFVNNYPNFKRSFYLRKRNGIYSRVFKKLQKNTASTLSQA